MEQYTKHGVTFFQSPLIPCPHGFSTRCGGVSREVHTAELNLAFGRGDTHKTVMENLRRFTKAVGVNAASVISLAQVHGSDVLRVGKQDSGLGYCKPSDESADGYYTTECGVTLGIKTADCVPILLCGKDGEGRVRAVSALHAGWRGTLAGIAENGVRAFMADGISPQHIYAAIGPAIGSCCYEVDEAFYRAFLEKLGEAFLKDTFFPCGGEKEGKYLADLKEINHRLLLRMGLLPQHIDVSDLCTACSPDLFYSHRASGGIRGTMLSVIAMPET